MKVGDFVYIKPVNTFGFIIKIDSKCLYKIEEAGFPQNWYYYNKHLVLIYEN